jgi:hypothetical protein
MKKRNLGKKLALNKQTVSDLNLNKRSMARIVGAASEPYVLCEQSYDGTCPTETNYCTCDTGTVCCPVSPVIPTNDTAAVCCPPPGTLDGPTCVTGDPQQLCCPISQ